MPNKIWIDVEDLFQYAAFNPRPSGIQRIEYELCRALATLPESRHRVGFVRHSSRRKSFYSIPYADLESLYGGLTGAGQARNRHPSRPSPRPTTKRPAALADSKLRRVAYSVPPALRSPMIAFWKAQRDSVDAVRQLAAALGRASGRLLSSGLQAYRKRLAGKGRTQGAAAEPDFDREAFETICGPQDVLLVLGSPWFHPFYSEMVGKLQLDRGVRFALLVYDIIPLRRPEWCDHNLVVRFSEWTGKVFPLVDIFLTISRASADDIVHHARRSGYALRSAPRPIPIGTGFTSPQHAGAPIAADSDGSSSRLPPAGSYALIVSTIEARKNHILLFRVWRRMLEEMPREQVPTLVFAGRVGWLVSDLMQQLRNTQYLDGKIMLVEDPSDDELERLYAGCRFTLFPSLYEGWGLPVTESLSFGRPCIISNATSLPEAGGQLARYFDPENAGEAYDVIRYAVETPDETNAWAERVQREFKPVTWEDSARGVLRALGGDPAAAPPPVRTVSEPPASAGFALSEEAPAHLL